MRTELSHAFKKGESGNPKGRPKREWTWAGVLERALEEENKQGISFKEIVAKSLIKECKNGNIYAIKELMNRMDGMPKQDIGIDSEGVTHLVNIDIHAPGTRNEPREE